MHFAYPLPWWLAALFATAIGAAVVFEYRRTLSPLTAFKRGVLVFLRALTLVLLVLFLFRPIIPLPPSGSREAVVPVLVDVSRSMRLNDADGLARLDRAKAVLKTTLLPALAPHFTTELYSVGSGVAPAVLDELTANARQTDVTGALSAIRERYRGQRVAGVVLLSDGGDTGQMNGAGASDAGGAPVFAIGIGSPEGFRDREVLAMTAGDPRLDQASVDLHVTAISSGFGRAPFQVRILGNGRLLETRRVLPIADGSPIDLVFTVSPDRAAPTVYTAEIPKDDSELVDENNSRSVLVSPPGRKRRLLVLEGAPGFDHSFMTRAWTHDPVLEVDSITRKGRNGEGVDTFFVQAGAGRGPELTGGFPPRRELLYTYDAVVIANV
ncbi:MAG TPA: hypothetical protein VNZ26_07645, partial [Vicinamibacterales bacterium]|nr:hypothetical protein [Vicinamibacterales bacterium]